MKLFFINFTKVLALATILVTTKVEAQTAVTIDFETQRYLNDVSELDRTKYFNIHMAPGKDYEDQDMEDLKEWGVTLGRSFWGAFGRYNDYISQNGLPSDNKIMVDGANSINSLKSSSHFKYVTKQMVVTDHPSAMIRMEMDTDEAGKFAAKYFKYNYEDDFRPDYYEPVNEPFVHADEFTENGKYTEAAVRRKTAEYFRDIGKAFKEEGLDTKVVGYSSAWPSLELWDFEHWNSRMKMFMDVAGEHMDGFSTHLYDGINVKGGDTERSGSNSIAILDLIETYSNIKWGKVKPHAITEYGGIPVTENNIYSDIISIQTIRSTNHLMFELMDREDRMLISIPFNTGKSPWFYEANDWEPYGANLWRPDKSSIVNNKPTRYFYTAKRYFYDLWKGVEGTRVRINTNDQDLLVQAFVDGNKAYVCLNSLRRENQTVALNFVSGLGNVSKVNKRSLKIYKEESPIYSDEDITNPQSVTLEPHETVVLTYDLERPVIFSKKSIRKEYYSEDHMKTIAANEKLTFSFKNVELDAANGEARLRMSIGRKHDKTKRPSVKVNGVTVSALNNWKGYDQADREDFFGSIEIPVPHSLLKQDNTVEITFPDDEGTVSSVVLKVINIYNQTQRVPFRSDIDLPSTIEAEDFDIGGLSIGYHSLNDVNEYGKYRINEGVNIKDGATNYDIVLNESEWTSYTVNVDESAIYTLAVDGASDSDVSEVVMTINNETVSAPLSFNADMNTSEATVEMPSGNYPIHLISQTGTATIDKLAFTLESILTDEIAFVSGDNEVESGTTNTYKVSYNASKDRDIVLELWGDAFLLGSARVEVAEGTSEIDIDLSIIAEPVNYQELELVARLVKRGSLSTLNIAEDTFDELNYNPILSSDDNLRLEEQITLFPNPLNGHQEINLRASSRIQKVEIIDLNGKVVDTFSFDLSANQVKLDLEGDYQNGIYLVKIISENGTTTKRILIR
ncbi:T9SS type A sorting domain-containing protein [Flammeovirga sp. MY04]|uniref:T9SS type A sorting domain-containing protein n=1 Tax=Flammeovirga sp. MY04 TaxID=1191459 RepID=UPI00080626D7|nr:T9SS type A sorting domain-containing protein [Flammeovirga sp. MY04]ANQ51562.1 T9SS type A sorting domain-containing protein [Flammeovirga sp. MY04]